MDARDAQAPSRYGMPPGQRPAGEPPDPAERALQQASKLCDADRYEQAAQLLYP